MAGAVFGRRASPLVPPSPTRTVTAPTSAVLSRPPRRGAQRPRLVPYPPLFRSARRERGIRLRHRRRRHPTNDRLVVGAVDRNSPQLSCAPGASPCEAFGYRTPRSEAGHRGTARVARSAARIYIARTVAVRARAA